MRVTNAAACLQTAAGSRVSRRRRAAYRANARWPTASDMMASARAHRRTSRGAIPICPVGQVAVTFTLIRILVAARLYSGRIQLEYSYIYVRTHTVRPFRCIFFWSLHARWNSGKSLTCKVSWSVACSVVVEMVMLAAMFARQLTFFRHSSHIFVRSAASRCVQVGPFRGLQYT